MKILGLDFETQDDQAETTNVTEIGALLTDNCFNELGRLSQLCWEPSYPPQTPEIVEITRITDDMLQKDGIPRREAFAQLLPLVEQADYVFAHKKDFDQVVFNSNCRKFGLPIPKKQWICTLTEINYPAKFRCKQLSHLAFEHRITFNPDELHRALDDVKLMMKLLAKYNLTDIITFANEPWVYVQAIFPAPFESKIGFEVGKAKASKLNFGWERARGDDREFSKKWVSRVKQRYLPEFKLKASNLALEIKVL